MLPPRHKGLGSLFSRRERSWLELLVGFAWLIPLALLFGQAYTYTDMWACYLLACFWSGCINCGYAVLQHETVSSKNLFRSFIGGTLFLPILTVVAFVATMVAALWFVLVPIGIIIFAYFLTSARDATAEEMAALNKRSNGNNDDLATKCFLKDPSLVNRATYYVSFPADSPRPQKTYEDMLAENRETFAEQLQDQLSDRDFGSN